MTVTNDKSPSSIKAFAFYISMLALWACVLHFGTPPTSALASNSNATAQAQLPMIILDIKGNKLKTEVARSAQQRYMGLSFRKTLAEDEAMLFVYPREQPLNFTMRNTLIPLSIAYISKDMVINEIHDMPVGPNQLFPSKRPAQFALEVNQGWFKRNKVGIGSIINLEKR